MSIKFLILITYVVIEFVLVSLLSTLTNFSYCSGVATVDFAQVNSG